MLVDEEINDSQNLPPWSEFTTAVIPAHAGIQGFCFGVFFFLLQSRKRQGDEKPERCHSPRHLDSGVRRNDVKTIKPEREEESDYKRGE